MHPQTRRDIPQPPTKAHCNTTALPARFRSALHHPACSFFRRTHRVGLSACPIDPIADIPAVAAVRPADDTALHHAVSTIPIPLAADARVFANAPVPNTRQRLRLPVPALAIAARLRTAAAATAAAHAVPRFHAADAALVRGHGAQRP